MQRIQRKRTKDFKLPENTACVDRTTKWGNPFKLESGFIYVKRPPKTTSMRPWECIEEGNLDDVVAMYERLFQTKNWSSFANRYWARYFQNLDLSELSGKNLACFCPLDQPCHADILLKLANPVTYGTDSI